MIRGTIEDLLKYWVHIVEFRLLFVYATIGVSDQRRKRRGQNGDSKVLFESPFELRWE